MRMYVHLVGLWFLAAGCAFASPPAILLPPAAATQHCGATPEETLRKLFRGINERDLRLLEKTLPAGRTLRETFLEKDAEGRRLTQLLVPHEETWRGNEVDSRYGLAEAERRLNGETKVVVERYDVITFYIGLSRDPERQAYRTELLVQFDPRNCIIRARPRDSRWWRIR